MSKDRKSYLCFLQQGEECYTGSGRYVFRRPNPAAPFGLGDEIKDIPDSHQQRVDTIVRARAFRTDAARVGLGVVALGLLSIVAVAVEHPEIVNSVIQHLGITAH